MGNSADKSVDRVVIRDVDIPFSRMITIVAKWTLASVIVGMVLQFQQSRFQHIDNYLGAYPNHGLCARHA